MGSFVVQETASGETRRSQAGSLRDRLRFAGLDEQQCALIRQHRPMLQALVKTGLRDVFNRYQSYPDAAGNFESERQIERLHDLQSSHWDVLTDGRFDSLYAERVKLLSEAESKMGLDPRWHIAGHAVVLEHILSGLAETMAPRGLLPGNRRKAREMTELMAAMVRLVMVDVEIAVSLRFNESRASHARALEGARREERATVETLFGGLAEALADQDLTARVEGEVPEDYRDLVARLNAGLDRIQSLMQDTAEGSARAETALSRFAETGRRLAEGSALDSEDLSATAGNLGALAARLRSSASDSRAAEQAAGTARKAAEDSGEVAGRAIAAMAGIEASAEKIGQIIGVIDEIAFQTNLLALNAGIEAARAGDSGRGFAVVAQEVRGLAQRSADAAREIKTLVTGTKAQVDAGVEMVARTQSSIDSIVAQVKDINAAISGIAHSAQDHADNLDAVTGTVADLGRRVAQGHTAADGMRGEADDLHAVILELGETIREFRVERQRWSEAPVRRPAPQPASPRPALAAPPRPEAPLARLGRAS